MPTPIGNLEDMTLRSLRILREATMILAEDTRHTRHLLRHFEIETPMRAYHQHNKMAALDSVLAWVSVGDVALVSDAGMPAVSDPGFELIAEAIRRGIAVDVLPGANAAVTAVVAAGIPAPGFLVLGFLPRKSGERRTRLHGMQALPYSLVLYEAPHRLLGMLQDVGDELGNRRLVVCRELTKVHQEYVRGVVSDVVAHFTDFPPRGECTIVIQGSEAAGPDVEAALREIQHRATTGEDRHAIFTDLSRRYGVRRSDLYAAWMSARASAHEADDEVVP